MVAFGDGDNDIEFLQAAVVNHSAGSEIVSEAGLSGVLALSE